MLDGGVELDDDVPIGIDEVVIEELEDVPMGIDIVDMDDAEDALIDDATED